MQPAADVGPLRIVVSGASGLVGSALLPALVAEGHRVSRLVRRSVAAPASEIPWDPAGGRLDPARLEGQDALIHLGGETIGAGRWSERRKTAIRESRVRSTALLAETLARLANPPRVFLCASAIGFYGDRGDTLLDETSAPGEGFLAEVCKAWESATEPASEAGIRVARLRFGVILSPSGGALPRIATPFRLGFGGKVGSGRQWMSWVALHDVVSALRFALSHPTLGGAVNVVAPAPVRNREFARVLGRVLRRPSIVPLPAALVRLLFGAMGNELLLASQRVAPRRLEEAGFHFRSEELEAALRYLVAPSRSSSP